MDGAVIYRREAETELLLLKNRPPISDVTYPICLKPYTGLVSQVAHVNNTRKNPTNFYLFIYFFVSNPAFYFLLILCAIAFSWHHRFCDTKYFKHSLLRQLLVSF